MGVVIYTNSNREDLGTLEHATCDFAFGSDENSFVVTLDRSAGLTLDPCALVYIEGTEFGGMVRGCETNTDPSVSTIQYTGPTWHGLLDRHIIKPDPGADYLTVSGEANAALGLIVERLGIGDLFSASAKNSGVEVNYQFERYTEAYKGLRKMLSKSGAKLCLEYDGNTVILSAKPITDHSLADALDTDKLALQMTKEFLPVNHLVCLGKGELHDRVVIDLFADENGVVSTTQTFFGSLENSLVYDYSSAEADELLTEGIKKLEELQNNNTTEAVFFEDLDYDIDDIVGAYDALTGELITAVIAKKILAVDRYGNQAVNYEIGSVSTVQTVSGGGFSGDLSSIVSQIENTAALAAGKADKQHDHDASAILTGVLSAERLPTIHGSKIADNSISSAKLDQATRDSISPISIISQLGEVTRLRFWESDWNQGYLYVYVGKTIYTFESIGKSYEG